MNKLNHVAFIMDGNGRWGKKKGKGRNFGHLKGIETVKKIVKLSIKLMQVSSTETLFSSINGFGVSRVNGFNLFPNPAHKIKAVLILILLSYKFRKIRC